MARNMVWRVINIPQKDEDNVVELLKNNKFHEVRNHFQMKIKEDLRKMRSSKNRWLLLIKHQIWTG